MKDETKKNKEFKPLKLDMTGLSDSRNFAYLCNSTCHEVKGHDDLMEFENMIGA